jgi:hypothetical protein
MYRSDHDAALARIAALEADLARERSDDAAREGKLAKLEAALARERIELARVEAELAKLRPKPKPPAPAPEPEAPKRTPSTYLGTVVFFAVIALLLVIAMATQCNKRKADEPVHAVRFARVPDEIDALLGAAKKRGHEVLPGSRMITISAKGVTEIGQLHPDYGELEADFQVTVSPPKGPDIDPSVPIGAAPPVDRSPFDDYKCTTLQYRNNEWTENSVLGGMCVVGDLYKNVSEIEPRCTMTSIWARARADGAPGGAIAELRLQQGSWHFSIRDQRATFEKRYPDDCE